MAEPRIDGIVARDAQIAVVFRRGPSKRTQMLVWNLETDEVEPGQWIGGRVYTRRCDLSPDGKLLVVACTNYSPRRQTTLQQGQDSWSNHGWTAVCRPPYFTAVGLWFSGGAWNGGGMWQDPRNLALNNFAHHWETIKIPSNLQIHSLNLPPSEDSPIFDMLLKARGWTEVVHQESVLVNPDFVHYAKELDSYVRPSQMSMKDILKLELLFEKATPKFETISKGLWQKPFPGGHLERVEDVNETWSIKNDDGQSIRSFAAPLFFPQWLDVDHRGRVIFGDGGKLWAWENCPRGELREIADLRENRFENVEAPEWATQVPE